MEQRDVLLRPKRWNANRVLAKSIVSKDFFVAFMVLVHRVCPCEETPPSLAVRPVIPCYRLAFDEASAQERDALLTYI